MTAADAIQLAVASGITGAAGAAALLILGSIIRDWFLDRRRKHLCETRRRDSRSILHRI